MNLYDCCIPYFAVPTYCLDLHSKSSILAALHAYRQRSIEGLTIPSIHTVTRHERRKAVETVRDLLDRDVINRAINGELTLWDMDTKEDSSAISIRIALPSECDYSVLSTTALRLLMLLHHKGRYSRKSFQIVKQAELATRLQTNRSRIRDAMEQLVEHRHLSIEKKIWKEGTKLVLCDPESSAELYWLAKYRTDGLDNVPVHDRYKAVLSRYDPRYHLENIREPVEGYKTRCPFCKNPPRTPSKQATLVFNSVEDWWNCSRCGCKGRSKQLWHKMTPFSANWQATIEDCIGNTVTPEEQESA